MNSNNKCPPHCCWANSRDGRCLWPGAWCPRREQVTVADLAAKLRRVIGSTDYARSRARRESREAELRDHQG